MRASVVIKATVCGVLATGEIRVSVRNTCSVLPMAAWGNKEQKQLVRLAYYSSLLTLDFFSLHLILGPLWETICFTVLGFLHSLHPMVSLIKLSYWNYCLMHLSQYGSLYRAFCQLPLNVAEKLIYVHAYVNQQS